MDASVLTNVSIVALGCLSGATLLSLAISNRRTSRTLQVLGPATGGVANARHVREALLRDATGIEFEQIKAATRQRLAKPNSGAAWHDRCFQAGLFTQEERSRFQLWKKIIGCTLPVVGFALGYMLGLPYAVLGLALGAALALQIPRSYLQRATERRSDDIMFYLPLVIEQLVIGVSSSLDVGPCIKWVVAMADERDSHNAVTELLRYAQQYMKSGVSMEEALVEVGRLSGHTELKHVFMALSQVARHGGEISKQLQELANAVSSQREARIEGKIKRLELEATGPVGLMFLAFMGTLLVGLGSQLLCAFG